MKQYIQIMFIVILAIVLGLLVALLLAQSIKAKESVAEEPIAGAIIWQMPCRGGTWVVIEDERDPSAGLWAVWCTRFNWFTRELTWVWGRACEPNYSTEVIVRENILGTPKAICRYKY